MPISADSRYANAVIQTVDTPFGPRQEMRVPLPRARRISYTYYRVKAGDRVDTIAAEFYGDPTLWWVIADANPEVMDWLWDPDTGPNNSPEDGAAYDGMVGRVLRIPNV